MTNEYERCVQFEDSLRNSLRVLIAPQRERDFSVLVEKAKIVEKARVDGSVRVGSTTAPVGVAICQLCNRLYLGECWRSTAACLWCGSIEHRIKDCLLRGNQVQALVVETAQPPRGVQQPPRGRGQAKGDNSMGRGQRAPDRDAELTEVRQPTLVYAARRHEDRDTPDVIADIGSTHSYVACSVSETLGISHESTSSEISVVSLLGQSIKVSKLFRDVLLEVQGTIFLADLMELPFGEFDLILDIDWLVKNRVSLNCAEKRLVLRTKEDNEIVVIGERQNYLSNVISVMVVEKLVRKECEVFLACISASDSVGLSVKDIRTVKDFPDVFPEELPGLPPGREVKFGIELIPGTAPVSIAPYQMAPKELMELKAQIQKLLDRGFIRLSVSP
ncbi:uncharacterized protein LOC108458830 [Gossypium arboreum]|uniref:uncharacterized protein LOC108458830 n=1 Tax=Gossypium arboreum TaxID=29729 RepID=UPI000818F54D|nr:uncharacterized protein LOC108458830 [Gossypium arboreum]